MKLRSILLLVFLPAITGLAGCAVRPAGDCKPGAPACVAGAAALTAADIGDAEQWGAAKNVVRVRNLYISSQPDAETLRIARVNGVGVVINFRPASEMQWDEEEASKELGLAYYNLPISRGGDTLDAQSVNRAGELVRQHADTGILLHCSSGNRAAAWFAVHLVQDDGMAIEPAIELASSAGLTSAGLRDRVRNYLAQGGDDLE